MKRSYVIIISIYLAIIASDQSLGQTMDVMSFNLRYDNPSDGDNNWHKRKKELVELVDYYHPDFLGSQEGLYHQIKYLNEQLHDYAMIGVGREDGKTKGEYTAIFFDSTRFELMSQGTFWLSEKPDTVSVGWDAALERICTYGLFRSKVSNQLLHVFNTHFDHVGTEAQLMSARLITKKIKTLTEDHAIAILTGDFNCLPDSQPITTIKAHLEDGLEASKKMLYGPLGTFNAFNKAQALTRRIDYIFTRNLNVTTYRHINDKRRDNGFISDHLPVLIQARLEDKATEVVSEVEQ